MKKLSILFMAFVTASFAITSCSDDDNATATGYDPTYASGDAPSVQSLSVENNAVGLDTIDSVVVTYDKPIYVPKNHSVRVVSYYGETDSILSTTYADSVKIRNEKELVIYFNTQGYTTYEVTIRKPTVHNGTYAYASDYKFKFTTDLINMFDPSPFSIDPAPSDPDATDEAKKLYEYLLSQFGKSTLSATMANVTWDTHYADSLYEVTGKYPAIATFDFIHLRWSKPLGNANWIDYTNTKVVEDWADAGGIVSAGWHWSVPISQMYVDNLNNYAFYQSSFPSTGAFSIANTTKTGKWENTQVNQDLDALASILLKLQEKKIALLWRPLHEAAGKWFWWGAKGSVYYKKLWTYMYTYLQGKGVHNLIWVWTSQGNSIDDSSWYPGDQYVDIIGRDDYDVKDHESLISEFQKLTSLSSGKKMVTLSECGAIPSVNSMVSDGAMWSYFMPWNGEYMHDKYNSGDFFKQQMNSKYVITRDELPALR